MKLVFKNKTRFMILGGLQKLTLIDYPGKIAATVFTFGCNFRCSFCHNYDLMGDHTDRVQKPISAQTFFKFLESRVDKLDGVCISGGEPTLHEDLPGFIEKIKKLGFLVKLDTNGTNPEMLQKLIKDKLVDYVAMDIKAPLQKYTQIAEVPVNQLKVQKSVQIIKSLARYEFRTTVVNNLHSKTDLIEIIDWIGGAKNYFLQQYHAVDFPTNNQDARPLAPFPQKDLEEVMVYARPRFENFGLRE